MAWTPSYTVLKTRAIPSNILTYVIDATRQADAITWAGGGSLKAFKTFSNSVANRTKPVFPSIAFSDDNDVQVFGDDLIEAVYSCIFEVSIQHSSPDTVVTNARYYAAALVSMIRNCPPATLAANTGADVYATVIEGVEVGFEQIKTNEMQNDFLQQFQIRVTVRLSAPNQT